MRELEKLQLPKMTDRATLTSLNRNFSILDENILKVADSTKAQLQEQNININDITKSISEMPKNYYIAEEHTLISENGKIIIELSRLDNDFVTKDIGGIVTLKPFKGDGLNLSDTDTVELRVPYALHYTLPNPTTNRKYSVKVGKININASELKKDWTYSFLLYRNDAYILNPPTINSNLDSGGFMDNLNNKLESIATSISSLDNKLNTISTNINRGAIKRMYHGFIEYLICDERVKITGSNYNTDKTVVLVTGFSGNQFETDYNVESVTTLGVSVKKFESSGYVTLGSFNPFTTAFSVSYTVIEFY